MNTKLFAGGAVLALLAMTMNVSAYHITGAQPVYTVGGIPFPIRGSAHEWTAKTNIFSPIDEPCNNQTPIPGGFTIESLWDFIRTTLAALHPLIAGLFGDLFTADGCIFVDPGLRNGDNILAVIAQCETDDQFFGFPEAQPNPGAGGLCSMSPGNDIVAAVPPATFNGCQFTATANGRSNGNGPDYDAAHQFTNGCENASGSGPGLGINPGQDFYGVVAVPAHDYYTFKMPACTAPAAAPAAVGCNPTGAAATFIVQVNGIGCDASGTQAEVDMQYAYATSSGHVAGFVTQDIEVGSYTVTHNSPSTTATGTPCITGTAAPLFH